MDNNLHFYTDQSTGKQTPGVLDGYTLVFDNVNQKTKARYNSREKGNKMLNMVQAYAAVDRVPSMSMDDTPTTQDDISTMSLEPFLPNDNDYEILR